MRRFLATCGIMISMAVIVTPLATDAFSECRSERHGYCVRLGQNDSSYQSSQRHQSGLAAVAFPGLEFLSTYGIDFESDIGKTLSALYNFGVVIAGISALIMFIYGGVRYLTAAGSTTAVSDARTRMFNAVFGLVLIALSYLILFTINPDFTLTLKLGDLCQQLYKESAAQNCSNQSTTQSSSQQQVPTFAQRQAVCPIDGFIGLPAACIPHCGALGGTCKLIPQ